MSIHLRLASLAAATAVVTACSAGLSLGGPAHGGGSTAPSTQGVAAPSADPVAAPTPATKFSDFAYEVKTATGDYHTGWIIDKLTTFEVAPKCYERMLDKDNNGAVHAATFYTRDVAALAKKLTGDDWSQIETQHNSDRENNKQLIEPMIDRFKARFGMTITVEGDDCDARQSSMWLRYWTTVGTALNTYPPETDAVFVHLVASASANETKVSFDDKTSTYTIVAPRDLEKGAWSTPIEKAIQRHARGAK